METEMLYHKHAPLYGRPYSVRVWFSGFGHNNPDRFLARLMG